jgi:integrase
MITKVGLYQDKAKKQWRVRWFGQYNPNIGKTKRYSKTFNRRADAERFIRTKEREFEQGTHRDVSTATLKDYTERWLLNKIAIEGIRLGTKVLYKETLDRLYKFFGEGCLVRSIDSMRAKDFLSSLKPLMKSKQVLSNWSRNRILRQCKTIFKSAVLDGIMSNNPFDNIKGAKCLTSQWYYMKEPEYLKLMDVTKSLTEKVLYALAYTAGLRETEALTLRWSDVDFEKNKIHIVNQPATKTLPPFVIKDSDQRIIPIPKHTINLLTMLQSESETGSPYIITTGEVYNRVLQRWHRCQQEGREWNYRDWAYNVPRNFNLRIKQSGIDTAGKSLTLHTLRKACIQNWQNYLPMNYVKAFAGHADITTTEKYYSTIDESRLNEISKAVDKRIDDAKITTTDLLMTFSGNLGSNKDTGSQEFGSQVSVNKEVTSFTAGVIQR